MQPKTLSRGVWGHAPLEKIWIWSIENGLEWTFLLYFQETDAFFQQVC